MLCRYLVLSPFPPSFRHPAFPLPATAHSFRLHNVTRNEAGNHELAQANGLPIVYFTLGTIFNVESGDLFERVLAGLRDLPINVITTVGREIDPAEFGPQSTNIRIERYIPQEIVLPQCALAISHGGSGSVIGALSHGVPMVLLPIGADQPHNSSRCEELGVAQVLDAVETTRETIRSAVTDVLADPLYRRNAEHLRDEIASLPGPDFALELLEQLAAEKQPIVSK
jgi:MGT family glycosyltransferase